MNRREDPKYVIKYFTNAVGPKREKSRFTYLNYYGQKVDIPYIVFGIDAGKEKVLVDCGCNLYQYNRYIKGYTDEQIQAAKSGDLFTAGGESFADIEDVTSFEDGLAEWGWKPEDVTILFITHLHWDHIMNINACPNARVLIQRDEWKFALEPHPIQKFAYADRWFYEQMKNVELVEGDYTLLPGIEVVKTPGHTPGGQSLLINTAKGVACLTGYCAINDNFYPPKSLTDKIGYPILAATVHVNSIDAYYSTLRLLQASDIVLPSHEVTLMASKQFPA